MVCVYVCVWLTRNAQWAHGSDSSAEAEPAPDAPPPRSPPAQVTALTKLTSPTLPAHLPDNYLLLLRLTNLILTVLTYLIRWTLKTDPEQGNENIIFFISSSGNPTLTWRPFTVTFLYPCPTTDIKKVTIFSKLNKKGCFIVKIKRLFHCKDSSIIKTLWLVFAIELLLSICSVRNRVRYL